MPTELWPTQQLAVGWNALTLASRRTAELFIGNQQIVGKWVELHAAVCPLVSPPGPNKQFQIQGHTDSPT